MNDAEENVGGDGVRALEQDGRGKKIEEMELERWTDGGDGTWD